VARRGDGAAGAQALADGPVLREGGGALDRRLVGPCGLVDGVGPVVAVDGAQLRQPGRGVVGAVRLGDVVLDQRVLGPAVDGEVGVSIRVEGGRVGDGPVRESVSPLVRLPQKRRDTYWALPVLQPLPTTKLPASPDQVTLYSPSSPFS
jgi:hypothetical protein